MPNVTLDQLQAVLMAEAFEVIAPLFGNLAQHLADSKNWVAELQQAHASMEQLSSALCEAMANVSITVPVPVQPSAAPTVKAPLCTELPTFRGHLEENVRAFLSITKDILLATHISRNDWRIIASGCLKEGAQTWYLAKCHSNRDSPLTWDALELELLAHFDHPAHTDEIRTKLQKCNYKNNMSDFILAFQKLEMQIAADKMTYGDHKWNFYCSLPAEICFHITWSSPKNMADVYKAAHTWEHYKCVSGARTADPHINKLNHSSSTSSSSATLFPSTAPVSASGLGPMDLDVHDQAQAKSDTSRIHCYNCNKPGHFTKDCCLPDHRKQGQAVGQQIRFGPRPMHLFDV
ncbi:hypothetical protein GYMLUDRAFT_53810 [Collybiopsis luxurians FD-317 M1]|nr:hypothetical protein GYMLUDRAFT_53810 [Collybiopsis luxurians FD-317 M1]